VIEPMDNMHLDDLIDRFFDCDLSGEDRSALEDALRSSPQARRFFWRKAETHAALRAWGREHWGRVAAAEAAGRDATEAGGGVARRWATASVPAGLLLIVALMVMTGLGLAGIQRFRAGILRRHDGPLPASNAVDPPVVAVLNASVEPVWGDPNVELMLRRGSLPDGPLELRSGSVELLFGSGGIAVIEGPAVFEPISSDALYVTQGSVRCLCPQPGSELRVETPKGTVTDLGTEFAMSIRPDTALRIGVIEGRVRLDLAASTQVMAAGEAVSVDGDGHATKDIGFFKDFKSRASLTPFDEVAFADGDDLLVDPSFESSSGGENASGAPPRQPPFAKALLKIGPWSGTPGHVESIEHPVATGERAVRISARSNPFWPLVVQQCGTGDISGKTVMASVKASRIAGDLLAGPQRAIVKIAFVDHKGIEFGSAERHFLKDGGPNDRFVEGRISAIAPPGTHAVNYTVLLNACGLSTGSIAIDDARLVVVERVAEAD
jgi:hypothetical protein